MTATATDIPLLSIKAQNAALAEELKAAACRVLDSRHQTVSIGKATNASPRETRCTPSTCGCGRTGRGAGKGTSRRQARARRRSPALPPEGCAPGR